MQQEEEEKVCNLCGNKIEKVKGVNQRAYEYELHYGFHISCERKYKEIVGKHKISFGDHVRAVIDGLYELFPELLQTKSVKDFNKRSREAEEELEMVFPYLKGKRKNIEGL